MPSSISESENPSRSVKRSVLGPASAGGSGGWLLSVRWVLSHLFVLAMVVIMISLGLWQIRRLEERQQRNSQISAIVETEPREIEMLLASPTLPPAHTPALVVGRYLNEHSFLVANRTYDTEPGNWLVTPLELRDTTVVAISRGWVPRLWAAGVHDQDLSAPEGEVVVVGSAFKSVDGGRIGSDDVAILTELNRLDLDRVRELTGLEVADLWVQLAEQHPNTQQSSGVSLPIPVPSESLDDGPHLSYAFQWFFFSAGAIVVYGLMLRRRHRESLR